LNTADVTSDDGMKQNVTLSAKMSGKAKLKSNSDVEFTMSLREMVKFSSIAEKEKKEHRCKVFCIDMGEGKGCVRLEWSDISKAYQLAGNGKTEDDTAKPQVERVVTPPKTPKKPKGLDSELNDTHTNVDPKSNRSMRKKDREQRIVKAQGKRETFDRMKETDYQSPARTG